MLTERSAFWSKANARSEKEKVASTLRPRQAGRMFLRYEFSDRRRKASFALEGKPGYHLLGIPECTFLGRTLLQKC